MPPNPQRKLPSTPPAPPIAPCKAGTWYLDRARRSDECEHHGYRRERADPDACNRASEEAWRNPFPAPLKGISITDHPSSGSPGRQPVPDKGSPRQACIMSHVTNPLRLARAFREILARELEAMVVG